MKNLYRAVIVDDEPLAREELQLNLSEYPEIQVVGEANNIQKAIEIIRKLKPDVVFLDVRMPGGTGFDVLNSLNNLELSFKVVFVSAYDEYVNRAFEMKALDYIHKPIDPDRLASAINLLKASDSE